MDQHDIPGGAAADHSAAEPSADEKVDHLTLPTIPTGVYSYFDKVQCWLKHPADRRTIARLRQQCGHLYVHNRAARFGGGYRQRLEFKQPSEAVLRWIADREDGWVNRIEVALDMIFPDRRDQERAQEFLHRHLVRRWHGKTHQIRMGRTTRRDTGGKGRFEPVEEIGRAVTRYDGPRSASNKLVNYKQDSRITGELNCLHLEWHLNNAGAARSAGIRSGRDLLRFDYREFWKDRLRLVDVDPERLGRLIRNRVNGTKSRAPEFGKFGRRVVNLDRKAGGVLLRPYDTMQEFIDDLGAALRLNRVVTIIPNDPLLPD